MRIKKEDVKRLSNALSGLFMKLEEVDGRCVQLTKDIDKQDLHLIGFIGEQGSVIMRDIAEFLEIPFSTATGIVDKLVAKEYFTRFHSEEDRRTVRVKLDKSGDEACCVFNTMKAEIGERMLKMLNQEEQERLIATLEKITFGLTKQQVVEKNVN